jgi:hypothetical protein
MLYESPDAGVWRPYGKQPPDRSVASSVVLNGEAGSATLLAATPSGSLVLALPDRARSVGRPAPATATVESLGPDAARWSETQVPCDSGYFETELSIAPNGSRWLACANEPSTGVQPKGLAVSDGAGKAWRVVARMCGLGTGCRERMPLVGYLGGLAAVSASSAFYIGDRSSLVGTFDGGLKWRTWPRVGGQDVGTAQVTFFGSHDGWAVTQGAYGHSSLWRTTDGGRVWTDR